ncbi:hypothetical protein ACFFP0_07410 [Rhizobium puerariae]|uniref:Uncharacterized protein n=1 Tax=Rhizobium puerariae TaxID=1585791 RepID=A0ABV6AH79_9HYPH
MSAPHFLHAVIKASGLTIGKWVPLKNHLMTYMSKFYAEIAELSMNLMPDRGKKSN